MDREGDEVEVIVNAKNLTYHRGCISQITVKDPRIKNKKFIGYSKNKNLMIYLLLERDIMDDKVFEMLEKIYSELTNFKSEVNQKFDGINQRLGEVNQKFDGINQRLDEVNKKANKNSILLEKMNDNIKILAEVQQKHLKINERQHEEMSEINKEELELLKSAIQHISHNI